MIINIKNNKLKKGPHILIIKYLKFLLNLGLLNPFFPNIIEIILTMKPKILFQTIKFIIETFLVNVYFNINNFNENKN